MRAPLYGALLSVTAFALCWAAALIANSWVSAAIYGPAALVAAAGFALTLRDRSP